MQKRYDFTPMQLFLVIHKLTIVTVADVLKFLSWVADISIEKHGQESLFEPNDQKFFTTAIASNSRGCSSSGYTYSTGSRKTGYYCVGLLSSGAVKLQRWSGGNVWE